MPASGLARDTTRLEFVDGVSLDYHTNKARHGVESSFSSSLSPFDITFAQCGCRCGATHAPTVVPVARSYTAPPSPFLPTQSRTLPSELPVPSTGTSSAVGKDSGAPSHLYSTAPTPSPSKRELSLPPMSVTMSPQFPNALPSAIEIARTKSPMIVPAPGTPSPAALTNTRTPFGTTGRYRHSLDWVRPFRHLLQSANLCRLGVRKRYLEDPSTLPPAQPASTPGTAPSSAPPLIPYTDPTGAASANPSTKPSRSPAEVEIAEPSDFPRTKQSVGPSLFPSASPVTVPSLLPSHDPSIRA